jgi:hypothetical protein
VQETLNLSGKIKQASQILKSESTTTWFGTGSLSLAQYHATGAFKALGRKYKALRATDTSTKTGRKPGMYVSLEDVQRYSSHFVGISVAVPSAMKRALRNYEYHIPFCRMDGFCSR